MNTQPHRRLSVRKRWWWMAAALVLVIGAAAAAGWQFPKLRQLAMSGFGGKAATSQTHAHHPGEAPDADDDHDEHKDADGDHEKHHDADGDEDEHGHAGEAKDAHAHEKKHYDHKHDEAGAIKLSKQAQGNIGVSLIKVERRAFERTMTVPGMIIERPGWSAVEITAPMTGVVTEIYPIQGEAVQPGQPLFDVRLTHEDLLQAQTEFLRTVEELDVIAREVARLEKVSADGVIAGKTLLERKYEQQKQEAALRAQRQALRLHGLSAAQVDNIAATRTLLQSLTVYAPAKTQSASAGHPNRHMQVQQLKVTPGKHVNTGDTLCLLVDHHQLYIEGIAFEQDIGAVNKTAADGRRVTAAFGSKSGKDEEIVPNLRILYLDDKVEPQSRAFHFYVALPNRVLRQDKSPDGRSFIYWQFKPGQRTQLRIPIDQWADRIVLPVEAVAQDGAESYVFENNDDHFDRRPVHIEYRDQDWVVLANDSDLKVGATIAASAAHQIQMALKNKSGGGVDPHAGHNH